MNRSMVAFALVHGLAVSAAGGCNSPSAAGDDVGPPDAPAEEAGSDIDADGDGEVGGGGDADGDADVHDAADPDADVLDTTDDADVHDAADGDSDAYDAAVPDADVRDAMDGDADGDAAGDVHDADPVVPGTWIAIESGVFQMGSPTSEPGHQGDETQHSVTLTHRFEILSTEVTQAQYEAQMGRNPSSHAGCPDCPVENVNWSEAADYCNALSTFAGLTTCYLCSGSGTSVLCLGNAAFATPYDCPGYRLPTEAEWECSVRASDLRATYNGDLTVGQLGCEEPNSVLDPIAWFCGNSGSASHAVGTRTANAWGLYDMPGNVWEWCHDVYRWDYEVDSPTDPWGPATGTDRVTRGSSWNNSAGSARAAYRGRSDWEFRNNVVGFRPVRTLP